MPGDADVRIGLRLAASLLSFAVAVLIFRWRKGLTRGDVFAALLLFLPVLAVDAAAMLAAPPAAHLWICALGVYACVFAAALVLLRKGMASGVGAFASAVVLRIFLQYIVLWGYGLAVK